MSEKEQKKESRSYSEEKITLELVKDKLKLITCNLDQSSSLVKTLGLEYDGYIRAVKPIVYRGE